MQKINNPDGKPISQCFMDDLWEVIEKYAMSGLTNAEALGMMQIVYQQFINSILKDKDDVREA